MSGAVVVMARAPLPGRCKTRLEPLLGAQRCAELQTTLIRQALALASTSPRATVLAFDPPGMRAELERLAGSGVELVEQPEGSLGDRLTAAAAFAFERFGGPIVLMGIDAPLLGARHLAAVDDAFVRGLDAYMVPATDGGYALLGLRRRADSVFALPTDAWGGPDVRALTLAALHRAGLRVGLFEPVDDLDTPDDARRLVRHPACPAELRAVLAPHLAVAA
jgi:uncharacterized protein